jgi:hypothetical protein
VGRLIDTRGRRVALMGSLGPPISQCLNSQTPQVNTPGRQESSKISKRRESIIGKLSIKDMPVLSLTRAACTKVIKNPSRASSEVVPKNCRSRRCRCPVQLRANVLKRAWSWGHRRSSWVLPENCRLTTYRGFAAAWPHI